MRMEENRDCVISLKGCHGNRGPAAGGRRLPANAIPWSLPMSCSTLSSSPDFSSPTLMYSFWMLRSHDLNAPSTSLLARRSLDSVAS